MARAEPSRSFGSSRAQHKCPTKFHFSSVRATRLSLLTWDADPPIRSGAPVLNTCVMHPPGGTALVRPLWSNEGRCFSKPIFQPEENERLRSLQKHLRAYLLRGAYQFLLRSLAPTLSPCVHHHLLVRCLGMALREVRRTLQERDIPRGV